MIVTLFDDSITIKQINQSSNWSDGVAGFTTERLNSVLRTRSQSDSNEETLAKQLNPIILIIVQY